jgi:glutamate-ammonia-ligase adenylyltransferase
MTPGGQLGSVPAGAALSDNDACAPLVDTAAASEPPSSHSRFAQRLRRRYAAELSLLPPGEPDLAKMAGAYEALRLRGDDVATALRILRQLVMERLMVLDCDRQAPLAVVTHAVTSLAEFALDIACDQAQRDLDAQHGAPLRADGQRAELWVVGMGKLGAR